MKSYLELYILLLALALISCEDTFDADPVDPRLPGYTESGYNNAAAFINGIPWRARITYAPFSGERGGYLRLLVNDSSQTTRVNISDGFFDLTNQSDFTRATVEFTLNNYAPGNFAELHALGTREFTLDGTSNFGMLILSNGDTLTPGTGRFFIRNVSQDEDEMIFSGTFGFEIRTDSIQYTIYKGRFDYALDPNDIRIIQ